MDIAELKSRSWEQQREHAVICLDAGGIVRDWNAAAAKLFGYTYDEMVGKDLHLLFNKEDLERGEHTNELKTAGVTGRAEDDRWMVRKDRSTFWASGVVSGITDDDGKLVGFVKILRDRTDVRSQLNTLQNKLDVATKAESTKNVFLATLVHELRNPLAVLRNASQVLRTLVVRCPELGKASELIERQLPYIERLLIDVGDMALVLEGRLRLALQLVDLRDVIAAAVEMCVPVLSERRQTVETLASGPMVIAADSLRLQQVFINLIINASKFSPAESTIWVKATVEGEEAVVRVEDKGRGISPDFLPHIFELFTQANYAEQAQAGGGMGLGLALVKRLVDLHQGTVSARSDGIGRGAEFSVRFPLCRR